MSDQPWGVGGEGSEETAVGPGSVGERKAADHPTAQDATRTGGDPDDLAYNPDESRRDAAEQGGQPNLDADPPVAGRPSHISPGTTDDEPRHAG